MVTTHVQEGGENMTKDLETYLRLAKAASDLKRAVGMIEAWTAKAEDARKRLADLTDEGDVKEEETVTYAVPVTEEPVSQPQ
jgi:hypothetical protein